jgi:hypothetical protein
LVGDGSFRKNSSHSSRLNPSFLSDLSTVNTATGKWTLTLYTALIDGAHALTVIEYDRAGNASPMSCLQGVGFLRPKYAVFHVQ